MFTEFYAALLSFILTAIFGVLLIPLLIRLKFGQRVRSDGPSRHIKKMGTPTMGGVIFIPAIGITAFMLSGNSREVLVAVLSMVGFGMIGFADDFIKVVKKKIFRLES